MNKYLIFFSGTLDNRKGGPAGYLANLKQGLIKIGLINNFYFLENKTPDDRNLKKKNNLRLNPFFRELFELFIVLNPIRRKSQISKLIDRNLSYSTVHFHSIIDFYYGYTFFRFQKKILTTHTPENFSSEYINNLKNITDSNYSFPFLKIVLDRMERRVLKIANFFIFPSEESLEPYQKTIKNFSKLMENKTIKFVLTGAEKPPILRNKELFSAENNLPSFKYNVAYIGRYNQVKGFDTFISLIKKTKQLDSNIFFISAGKGPIDPPVLDNYANLGWIKDPGSLINYVDAIIIPNKNTFFDLLAIEAISLNKLLISSNTGGNKTLKKIDVNNQMIIYETEDQLLNLVLKKLNFKNSISELYKNYLNTETFAKKYAEIFEKF